MLCPWDHHLNQQFTPNSTKVQKTERSLNYRSFPGNTVFSLEAKPDPQLSFGQHDQHGVKYT